MSEMYDLIIIGLGPAGLTASIYASRYKLKNLVVGEILAGELSKGYKIENLPGFVSISGMEWGEKTKEQVEKLGAEVVVDRVGRIERVNSQFPIPNFQIKMESGKKYQAKALIVATGSERRKLGIPGEREYLGRGVSYCTTCDMPFFKDKMVAMIGGSDAAVSGAVHGSEFAKKVYIIYRKEKLRAEPIWVEEWKKIEQSGKGEMIYNTNITRIIGASEIDNLKVKSEKLKVTVKNSNLDRQLNNRALEQSNNESLDKVAAVELDHSYKGSEYLSVEGVFIEIGGVPGTSLIKPLGVELTESGHVKVSEMMETSLPGLYAAGDMTDRSVVLPQAITAMAQGAMAAASAYKYLKGKEAPKILGL